MVGESDCGAVGSYPVSEATLFDLSLFVLTLDTYKEGDNPLYQVRDGWLGWPEDAKEIDVLNWLAPIVDRLLDFAENHLLGISESTVAASTIPQFFLQGSTVRKLDVGFEDDLNACTYSKCHWLQILILTEEE